MSIQNIPEKFLKSKKHNPALFVYDFKMTQNVVKSKVNLTLNMFSFLQKGEKKVRLEDASVEVNNKQSVLIKAGNCLMTEFTNKNVADFLEKHPYLNSTKNLSIENPFFVIENDEFINSFVTSINSILHLTTDYTSLLYIKFEEIMLY
jgi:AraC family transcriptional regulator, exoenzyme S synthesis regulatory protein ExsA